MHNTTTQPPAMRNFGFKIPKLGIRVFQKDTRHKELLYALIYETMSKLPARDSTNKITATIEALLDSVIANKFGDDPEHIKQGVEQYLEQVDAKHNNAAWQSLTAYLNFFTVINWVETVAKWQYVLSTLHYLVSAYGRVCVGFIYK